MSCYCLFLLGWIDETRDVCEWARVQSEHNCLGKWFYYQRKSHFERWATTDAGTV